MYRRREHEVAPGIFISSARVTQLRYPKKFKARQLVTKAIKAGRLVPKPCEICGDKLSEAHHVDYSKPLKVKWLCRKHHCMADRGQKKSRLKKFKYTTTPELHAAGAALGRLGGQSRAKKFNQRGGGPGGR